MMPLVWIKREEVMEEHPVSQASELPGPLHTQFLMFHLHSWYSVYHELLVHTPNLMAWWVWYHRFMMTIPNGVLIGCLVIRHQCLPGPQSKPEFFSQKNSLGSRL